MDLRLAPSGTGRLSGRACNDPDAGSIRAGGRRPLPRAAGPPRTGGGVLSHRRGAGEVVPKVSDSHLQSRRQAILHAAATCFARDGFHRTSMHDIVRESGVSAGLMYRYFAGKDDMIAA